MEFNIMEFITKIYESITFDSFIKFVIVYFFVIWIALLLWVMKDISNRTNNIFLQILSILIVLLLTPFGIFIYLLIRPGRTLFEKYYEEIEQNLDMFNQIIEEKNQNISKEIICNNCEEKVDNDFKFCPKCKETLKNECKGCGKLLNSDWIVCPYCGSKQKKKDNKKSEISETENSNKNIKNQEKNITDNKIEKNPDEMVEKTVIKKITF